MCFIRFDFVLALKLLLRLKALFSPLSSSLSLRRFQSTFVRFVEESKKKKNLLCNCCSLSLRLLSIPFARIISVQSFSYYGGWARESVCGCKKCASCSPRSRFWSYLASRLVPRRSPPFRTLFAPSRYIGAAIC